MTDLKLNKKENSEQLNLGKNYESLDGPCNISSDTFDYMNYAKRENKVPM